MTLAGTSRVPTRLARRATRTTVAATAAALALTLVAVGTQTAQAGPSFHPGAPGVGDPYFPMLGNGGYDVGHYTLDLSYRPSQRWLSGTVTIAAKATQNLSRFDLDLSGMHVHRVTVNNVAATWTRSGEELRITPRSGLFHGQAFSVAVTYDGSPKTITGSPIVFGTDYGWQYTPDGAFVGDEPNAAHTWFPSNDHPSDKATFTYRIAVPCSRAVVANGDLLSRTTQGGSTTYLWNETSPMATYLATIDIGKWNFDRSRTPSGIRNITAYDPDLRAGMRQNHVIGLTNRVTDFWSRSFGPYPFSSTGAIVDNVPDVGFSLETQTRPLYGFAPDPVTLSHELSHQWFGDSVSVATWQNIWLNEGFATFSQFYWGEHTGGPTTYQALRQIWNQVPAANAFWDQSIADPKRDTMFSSAVYYRGGMTLAALRHRIGDADFFRILRTWTATHRYGLATTAQFVALCERISGRDLSSFFHTWLWDKTKPSTFG
jgi:aminopeptidase N